MSHSMQNFPASTASLNTPQNMGPQSAPPGAFARGPGGMGGIQAVPSSLGTFGGMPPQSYQGAPVGAYGAPPQSYGGPLTQNQALGSAPSIPGGMAPGPSGGFAMGEAGMMGAPMSAMSAQGGPPLGSAPLPGPPPFQSAQQAPLPPPNGAPPQMSQMQMSQMQQMQMAGQMAGQMDPRMAGQQMGGPLAGQMSGQNAGQYMPGVARPQVVGTANPPVMANNIQYGPSYKMNYQRRSTSDKNAVKYTGFLPLEGVYEEDTCRIG